MGYYPFNGNANDESGSGNNGTVIGGATLTADRFGQTNRAYLFDGSSGYIDVGNPVGNNPVNLTQTAWVKMLSREPGFEYDSLITKRQQDGGSDWPSLCVGAGSSTGQPIFMLDDAGYQTLATSPFSIDLGTWAFVCGVKQGQAYQIYVNGILQSSFTDSHVTDGSPFNMYFMRHGAWNKYANGVLDDVRIYNRALSSGEVSQLYQMEGGVSDYTLFGLDAGDDTIYIIDPVTGALRPFAKAPFDLGAWPAFDYNPADAKLYLVHNPGSGPSLYQVNTQTGVISSTPRLLIQNEGGNSLGFTGTGDFYLYQERSGFSTGTLHFVNGVTGA
ncbi:MAG: LamG domain-containing protein, partial [Betaproteobacteria bacterium]|nr:LamG domain-containing protein [Betaproteobacteria bacterium]